MGNKILLHVYYVICDVCFLIASMVHFITWFQHKITIQIVRSTHKHQGQQRSRCTWERWHHQRLRHPCTLHTHSTHNLVSSRKNPLINKPHQHNRSLQSFVQKEHTRHMVEAIHNINMWGKKLMVTNSTKKLSYHFWRPTHQQHTYNTKPRI